MGSSSQIATEPQSLVTATRFPSDMNSASPKTRGAGRFANSASPVRPTSQIFAAERSLAPAITRLPSGENATPPMPPAISGDDSDMTSLPSCSPIFHTCAAPSSPPVTMRVPSGLHATAQTNDLWPHSSCWSSPVLASQISITPLAPTVAIDRSFGAPRQCVDELRAVELDERVTARDVHDHDAAVGGHHCDPPPVGTRGTRRRCRNRRSLARAYGTSGSRRPVARSTTRTIRLSHTAATNAPSSLKEGSRAEPGPDSLVMSAPVSGSQTFNTPSSPVVASMEPSRLNATSVISPSCPRNGGSSAHS